MTKTRTQQRGICIYCGKEHALAANETMVAHGYTLAYGGQHGNCTGVSRVHLGNVGAPSEIERAIIHLESFLSDLPNQIQACENELKSILNQEGNSSTARNQRQTLRDLKAGLIAIPQAIERLKSLKANWKEKAPRLVDLDVEEAEQRKAREAEAAQKKADKHEKAKAKAAAAEAREAKTAAKWALILAENLHQIEENGVVLVEWVAAYETRNAMERDHGERLSQWCDENGVNDTQDRIDMAWTVTMRVRNNSGKNKQLHKW